MRRFWIWRRDATRSYEIGPWHVTPVVRSIGLRWPNGGWLWQFPVAVETEDRRTGALDSVHVPDPTRTTLWFLYALTVVVLVAAVMMWRRSRRG